MGYIHEVESKDINFRSNLKELQLNRAEWGQEQKLHTIPISNEDFVPYNHIHREPKRVAQPSKRVRSSTITWVHKKSGDPTPGSKEHKSVMGDHKAIKIFRINTRTLGQKQGRLR